MSKDDIKKLEAELKNLISEKEKKDKIEELKSKIADLKKENKPDSTLKRMGRGFKYMFKGISTGYTKLANSDYVQGIKEEERTASSDAFYPKELLDNEEKPKKKKDEFATDTSNIMFTDL